MAEAAPVVHIGENSPQQIAYKLLLLIAAKEGKLLDEPSGGGHATADRKWLLDTYAECLRTVQNPSSRERPERIVALTTGGSFMVLCMVIPHLKKPIPNPPAAAGPRV